MNITSKARRFSRLTTAAFCIAMAGCATDEIGTGTEVWRDCSNSCHAVFRHEWSDIYFASATSAAPFQIVLAVAGTAATVAKNETPLDAKTTAQSSAEKTAKVESVATPAAAESRPAPAAKTLVAAPDGMNMASVTTEQRSAEASAQTVDTASRAGTVAKVQSGATHANVYGAKTKTESQTAGSVSSFATAGQVASVRSSSTKSKISASSGTSVQQFSASTSTEQRAVAEVRQYQSGQETRTAFPVLNIEMKARVAQVLAGQDVIFDHTLKNDGDLNLRDITVLIGGVEGLSFVGIERQTGGSISPKPGEPAGTAYVVRGNLAAGAQLQFSTRFHTPKPAP